MYEKSYNKEPVNKEKKIHTVFILFMKKQIIALTHSSALTIVRCTISGYVRVAGTGFGHPIFSYLSMGDILSYMHIS